MTGLPVSKARTMSCPMRSSVEDEWLCNHEKCMWWRPDEFTQHEEGSGDCAIYKLSTGIDWIYSIHQFLAEHMQKGA